jgi:acylphosphatase
MDKQHNNLKPRRVTALFDGRVQGVGFRFTTVEIARNHPVRGYVQNLMDGSVKLVAEGREPDLYTFLNQIRDAHIFRYVTREDLSWSDATGEFPEFTIRYS